MRFSSDISLVETCLLIVWFPSFKFGEACRRLVVGTGAYGKLPVMKEVKHEAERRKIELLALPTTQAIETLEEGIEGTNAILHVTC